MNKARFMLEQINAFSRQQFVREIGPVFEHSPWIADATWPRRPFASLDALHRALCETVTRADEANQLQLIRAHPDLGSRAITLSAESAREQAGARLDRLSNPEAATFMKLNQAYRDKFGFPFVICARLNNKEAILAGLHARLANSPEQEIHTALEEIFKIARLRLDDLMEAADSPMRLTN